MKSNISNGSKVSREAGAIQRAQVLHCSGQCERLVREADRRAITGVTRTLWWKMEREGLAPKRVRLSIHCVAWRLSDLLWWIEQRKAA
ncbi:helix-turn-helix transcriptional regulator [Aeromonas sp. R2-1]|uniref:helix-turn-helix transcriptional regulator n=1 Tax=Aeromonas sp. R2-1 TaxID=3138459 RepID=UPI0034A1526A